MAVRDTQVIRYLLEALESQGERVERKQTPFNPDYTYHAKTGTTDFALPYSKIYKHSRRLLPPFYRNSFTNTPEGNLEMAAKIAHDLNFRTGGPDLLAPYRQNEHGQVEIQELDRFHQQFQQDVQEEQDKREQS